MTQKDRLRNFFQSCPGQWIALTTILDMRISQYGSRILDLRREGMQIDNKVVKVVNGQKWTAFRYRPQVEQMEMFS
ncbi:MAG: hypothetical protein HQ579_07570 [Candidatus Omnitrophica bacterium]|nr:hypothetical protein [Candidatus Omnitrophota bacterium]